MAIREELLLTGVGWKEASLDQHHHGEMTYGLFSLRDADVLHNYRPDLARETLNQVQHCSMLTPRGVAPLNGALIRTLAQQI